MARKKLRIKFLTNGGYNKWSQVPINPSYLILKNYYEFRGKYPVKWLEWDAVILDDEETQIKRIVKEKPDILALAFFVWNEKRQFFIARRIKELLPNTVIIGGGPQLDAHKDKKFFDKYPYIDWVCYGDGEKSFTQLIHHLHGDKEDFVNLVENRNGEYILHPYEFFNDEEFFERPTYLLQKKVMESLLKRLLDFGFHRSYIEVGVEFARGCMYKCSFCDWSQNLTKKVKRRKFHWKDEIDYIKELDIVGYATDANFGLWKEDIDIMEYCYTIYDPTKNFRFMTGNTPKLKKDAIYYITWFQATHYDVPAILNIQDINEDVLANIDRPSVPYNEVVEIIQKLKQNLPDNKKHMITGQVIVGLPGQTYERNAAMMKQLVLDGINPQLIWTNVWVYLVNAPAADKLYQKLHGLEWIDAYSFYRHNESLNKGVEDILAKPLEEIYAMVARGDFHPSMIGFKLIKKTKTMDIKDIFASKNLGRLYRVHSLNNPNIPLPQYTNKEFLDEVAPILEKESVAEAQQWWEQNKDLMEKYGFVLYVWKKTPTRTEAITF